MEHDLTTSNRRTYTIYGLAEDRVDENIMKTVCIGKQERNPDKTTTEMK